MTGRDLFGALARAMGLWLLIVGIRHLSAAVYYGWTAGFSAGVVGEYLVRATPEFLIGLFLLAKASSVARLCYRDTAAASGSTTPGAGIRQDQPRQVAD